MTSHCGYSRARHPVLKDLPWRAGLELATVARLSGYGQSKGMAPSGAHAASRAPPGGSVCVKRVCEVSWGSPSQRGTSTGQWSPGVGMDKVPATGSSECTVHH